MFAIYAYAIDEIFLVEDFYDKITVHYGKWNSPFVVSSIMNEDSFIFLGEL